MNLAGFEIRDAIESDLPAIVGIYNATIPGRMVTADTEPVSVESRRPWFQAHNPQSRPLWVLVDRAAHDPVCGWLSFNSFYGRPAYLPTAELSLYLRDNYRRRGLGRGLLQEGIRRAPACGIKTLLGFVFAHNAPSLGVLESEGFARWGTLPHVAVLDGVERDVVLLGRRVAE